MRRFTSLLTSYVSGKKKTLKYEFAVAAFGVWIAATIRVFLSGDAAWISAQGVNYATLTSTVFLFITAAVGIQAWQNTRDDGAAPSTDPAYQDGATEPPAPSPEAAARSVG